MLQLSENIMRDLNQYYPGNSAGDHFRMVTKYDPRPKDVGDRDQMWGIQRLANLINCDCVVQTACFGFSMWLCSKGF